MLIPVFFRLCVSLADTPMQEVVDAAREPPFEPRSFSTRPE